MDKYSSLVDMAAVLGIADLSVEEGDGVLRIGGIASNEEEKQQLLDECTRIDPNYASGEVEFNIKNAAAGTTTTYTVRSGDTLSAIGSRYGVSWQAIFEANRDKLDNPDLIKPGRELTIP